jgi:hypothetical protein
MNAGAEEQNALSFAHGFGNGVEIVHRISPEAEGKESRRSFSAEERADSNEIAAVLL